jgi:hypothetical protein
MNPIKPVQRSRSARRALTAVVAPGVLVFGMVALSACGDDDEDSPIDSIVESIPPLDSVTDVTVTAETVTGETMAPADTMAVDSTTAP